MGSTHAHAPWRKAVLIPFWTIQLLIGLLDLAILALAVGVIVNWSNNNGDNLDWSDVSTEAKMYVLSSDPIWISANYICSSIVPIWMAMLVICLVLTITEIILLARHKLKPKTFVIFNTIKSTVWTAIFILDIVSFVDSGSRTVSFVGLIIEGVLWYVLPYLYTEEGDSADIWNARLCFIIPLIYGSIIYHRTRREAKYAPVIDPHANRAPDALPDYPAMPNTYAGYTAKAYSPTDIESQVQPSGERRASYNHERDTRFEAFRSSSYGNESYLPYSPEVHGDTAYRGAMPTGGQVPPMGGRSPGMGSPEIPQVYVQHHDGESYEMEGKSRRELR